MSALLQASVFSGPANWKARAPEWDALLAASVQSVGGWSSWVLPEVQAAGADGWGVFVRSTDGSLVAAGLFVDVERDGVRTATLAGTDGGYWAVLPAIDASAGDELARVVLGELDRRGVAADFGPLPTDSLVVPALIDGCAELVPSAVIPHLRRGDSDDARDYLSSGVRKTLRKARNRMVTDGVEPRIQVIRQTPEIAALLPAMESIFRARDHRGGRVSPLDTVAGRNLWRDRILALLNKGHGEIAVLWLNEEFSAYTVGLRSRGWYGLGEGRFETAHGRYTPGRYLEALVLQRVLADPDLHGIDWLSAVAPETLLAWNGASATVRLIRARRFPDVPRPRSTADMTFGTVSSAR